ncbi:MAG: long-chain-fatty-acid--CoA ligase [Hyphomicrobiales bacterium]|nr:long-chain-fatty-acid--CoA ligase [Hyphomicrobiales bacterium]
MDERPWLASYPPGVPAEVDASIYPSLVALFAESFAKNHDLPAYECMGRQLTFGDIERTSRDLGAFLQSLGLARGDRVAVMMPNVLQYPVVVSAILRAGFIAVNVNPLYTPRELEHQLSDSGAKAIFILENFAATLQQALEKTQIRHIVIASMGDMLGFAKGAIVNFVVRRKMVPAYALPGALRFNAVLASGAGKTLDEPELKPADPAVLQYTGGTTGVSKGATLTHGALIAAVLASEAWLQPALAAKQATTQLVAVCALPLYHVFAFVSCSLLAMRAGALCLLIPNPRDIPGFVKELRGRKFHLLPAVNTLFNGLLGNEDFAKLDFSELMVSNGGGMAVQEAVARKWKDVTGIPIVEGYGLSETSSGVVCNPVTLDAFNGTVGLPMPSVEIRILADNGAVLSPGAAGEVAIRGPQVMANYWNRPDETANVMTSDGFFKSGDIGVLDEKGFLRIVDRKKDMINVSGFNVYPNEIEAVVAEHPGVLECAAVGVPDPRSGEAVMLFVVPRDPKLTKEELAAFYKQQLTGYKTPKHVEFRKTLPKTNVGKILRRELRDEIVGAAPKAGV